MILTFHFEDRLLVLTFYFPWPPSATVVISLSRRLRLITLTKTLIFPDIAKTESNNCFIIHCLTGKQNNANNFNICVLLVFRLLNAFFLKIFMEHFLRNFCQPSFVFRVFQFLARLKKRIDEPWIYFGFRCLPHCSRKSCIAHATRLFTNLLAD